MIRRHGAVIGQIGRRSRSRDSHNTQLRYDYHGPCYFVGVLKPSAVFFQICTIPRELSHKVECLTGFNNTGNVRIWPSEECLAAICLATELKKELSGKRVIELGGGMTSLAGFVLAKCLDVRSMTVSDGNDDSVGNLQLILEANRDLKNKMSVRKLRWNDSLPMLDVSSFDVVVAADCLFFDEFRSDLLDTISSLLDRNGIAVIVAPRRNGTFEKFEEIARERFEVVSSGHEFKGVREHMENMRSTMKARRDYDEDRHLPRLVVLKKNLREPNLARSNL